MISNYGEIDNELLVRCLERYINRIWKIIPMNEKDEERETLPIYADSLVRELIGNSQILFEEHFLEIVGTLKGLQYEDHSSVRTDVFKAINIVKKIQRELFSCGLN